ncbi:hypothetical protein FRB98_002533 [Tulasnella sp. 332]|nr:hypothetical protein FRB98_002533 [Tulasnella sp. 332]
MAKQNPECQKSHWKEHKPLCLAARASAPPRGESDGLLEWINRNKGPLNQAGNEVLLPSKDQPTRNRLDSHVLWVIVKPIIPLPSPSSDFEVILAGPRPIDRFKSMLDENRPGTFDYLRDFTLASPHAVEAGGGKPDGVAGVMWFAIECKEMKATTTVQLVIGRDMLEHRRETRVYLDRWLEELKAFTAPGVRTYGLGDYTLAVKKPNTRRQKQTAESVPAEQKARLRKLSIWK